jgi:hypothetical protein
VPTATVHCQSALRGPLRNRGPRARSASLAHTTTAAAASPAGTASAPARRSLQGAGRAGAAAELRHGEPAQVGSMPPHTRRSRSRRGRPVQPTIDRWAKRGPDAQHGRRVRCPNAEKFAITIPSNAHEAACAAWRQMAGVTLVFVCNARFSIEDGMPPPIAAAPPRTTQRRVAVRQKWKNLVPLQVPPSIRPLTP